MVIVILYFLIGGIAALFFYNKCKVEHRFHEEETLNWKKPNVYTNYPKRNAWASVWHDCTTILYSILICLFWIVVIPVYFIQKLFMKVLYALNKKIETFLINQKTKKAK